MTPELWVSIITSVIAAGFAILGRMIELRCFQVQTTAPKRPRLPLRRRIRVSV